jgi:hypothetical protein
MLSIAGSFGVVIVSGVAVWKAGRSTVVASIVIVEKFAISDTWTIGNLELMVLRSQKIS